MGHGKHSPNEMGHSPNEMSREFKYMPAVEDMTGQRASSIVNAGARSRMGGQPQMGHDSPAKNLGHGMDDMSPEKGAHRKYHLKQRMSKKSKDSVAEMGNDSPAKKQGYNARLDESLAKDGKESTMQQSMKDRRDESKGMEESTGKGAYSSDPSMS